jgi:hypothetical protein
MPAVTLAALNNLKELAGAVGFHRAPVRRAQRDLWPADAAAPFPLSMRPSLASASASPRMSWLVPIAAAAPTPVLWGRVSA